MWTRRQFLARGVGLTGLAAGTNALLAVNRGNLPDGSAARGMITTETDEAIRKGLAFLAGNQHGDGSFGTLMHRGNVAITSLAALAFMSGGHQPGRNQYGKNVSRALEFVLTQTRAIQDTGTYICSDGGFQRGLEERMYGHGFATLFLGEVYGMVHDPALRKRLRATLHDAIKLIVNTQNIEGGWRYEPKANDSDISVTICQIMALRSARNAGIAVPKSTVTKCVEYVKNCQNLNKPNERPQAFNDGGFNYTRRAVGSSGFARSAAGVVALYSAGVYKGPEIDAGLKYLMTFKPSGRQQNVNWNNRAAQEMQVYYFYGHYYAAQAMWTAGGKYWREWYPAIREELLTNPDHKRDGFWSDRFCNHYGTAMALIILQIPNNYLPILQK